MNSAKPTCTACGEFITPSHSKDLTCDGCQYNGWTNRETWACHLWLTNEQDWFECHGLDADHIRLNLEESRNNVADGSACEIERQMITDIGSLHRVNWQEIADALAEGETK